MEINNKWLSIIVPVYNVEKYIRNCLVSLYNQGLDEDNFEIILVNDGTKDHSMDVIEDIINDHFNIIVIEQNNQGISVARNNGLQIAHGEYVLFVDSDDLLVEFSLKEILNKTREASVDITIAGFRSINDEEITISKCKPFNDCDYRLLSSKDFFLNEFNPRDCFVWHSLYKKDFLINNKIRFVEGLFFEDIPYTTECFLKAKTCLVTNQLLYIYRRHTSSIISNINDDKLLSLNEVINRLVHIQKSQNLSLKIKSQVNHTAFVVFSLLVCYIYRDEFLYKSRKKIIGDLRTKVPNLWFWRDVKGFMVSIVYNLMPIGYVSIRRLMYVSMNGLKCL